LQLAGRDATLWAYMSSGQHARRTKGILSVKEALDTFGLVITTDEETRKGINQQLYNYCTHQTPNVVGHRRFCRAKAEYFVGWLGPGG
jgi:hypothetical protein